MWGKFLICSPKLVDFPLTGIMLSTLRIYLEMDAVHVLSNPAEQSTLHGEYLKIIPNIHLRVLIWNQTGLLETYVFGQYCLYVKLLALSFMLALCLKGTVMWNPLQLTLEQHSFKLCRFICRHFFNKYIEYHMIWDWLNLSMWKHDCKGLTEGLEHLRVLQSMVGPGANPLRILREHL